MRLKRLELFGFKSFADRTALDFPHSLTGIVGPNGCGKSNVVDAVRWVLGEQRPTSMRGGEMSDVIFKGSTSRPGMGVAEVTLVLDNTQDELVGHGAEVSITRRVFKSGEGEYLINGDRVRLKDVRDMLYDTGLGSRGYSVLEQGRIDAVLSQNPLDRRAIFEEAAGISRYRMRRRETESRLKRVEADLLRLDDVLRELGTRVRSLKIQAGKAERFVVARDTWRRERARQLRQRLAASALGLSEIVTRIEALESRAALLRAARETGEGVVGERGREQHALAAEIERTADEISRLAGEGRALAERQAQLASRIQSWRASAQEESSRSGALEKQLAARRMELARVEENQTELAQRAQESERELAARSERVNEARNAYRVSRERSEAHNEQVLAALHEKTAAANSARLLEVSREPLLARRERSLARLAENEAQARALSEAAAAAAARVEALRLSLADSEQERVRLSEEFSRLEREARERDGRHKALELERARTVSRVAVLRDFERERESLEAGARALLAEVRTNRGPIGAAELSGLFADHLRTSTDLARALDAALGDRALGLVAAEDETARRAAAWLKEKKAGQVRLVLTAGTELPASPRAPTPEFSAEERALIVARLSEAVSAEGRYRALADALVGDVFVAVDVAACLRLVRAYPAWRFATREGDLVDATGFVGGHRELVQGAVGRRSSADALEETARDLGARIAELEREDQEARAVRDRLLELRAGTEKLFEERRDKLATAEREAHTGRARISDLGSTLSILRRECDGIAAEVERLDADQAAARERAVAAETRFEALNRELAELDRARHAQEALRDQTAREEQELSVQRARLVAELEGLGRRRADLARAVSDAQLELERSVRLAREHSSSADEAALQIEEHKRAADLCLTQRADLEGRLGELRSGERAAREAIDDFRKQLDAATRELESVAEALSAARMDAQRLEIERTEALTRAQEDLGFDEAGLTASFEGPGEEQALDAAELSALEARVAELKQDLDRIGPVNTEAVGELTEAEGRFQFLDTQRKDLAHSKQALADTLATLHEESLRLFQATFDEVRTHFQELFRQLFGGGRADLELQQGVDPLEGGIEITARPPGREMLPIGLLSGGQRTMTALALLFAVFKARPSPFCVLDEVDAALDDANIGRFLGMLDGFRATTQFIVVTHNKGSMAACDGLYGITMEVKGVSRYVAVEFGNVEQFDPEATGNASESARSRREVGSRALPAPETRSGAEPRSGGDQGGAAEAAPNGNGPGSSSPEETPVEEDPSLRTVEIRPQAGAPSAARADGGTGALLAATPEQ